LINFTSIQKPFAQSCEDNKAVILEQLIKPLSSSVRLLEIGSGTGQHALHFAAHLPHLCWQPTELSENIAGIELWMDEAAIPNIEKPKVLDVAEEKWPFEKQFDAAFTANTLHIMSLEHVEKMFAGIGRVLCEGGLFFCYGPFNYNGQFTSESNVRFESWLKERDPLSGIRDIDELKTFARINSIEIKDDIEMPANNRLLVWQKR